jgi:nitroimidazol reductase NimA-like FMN-containing flavoprotein (pyridoxamine 5'-phosphate oxidase superfamily)
MSESAKEKQERINILLGSQQLAVLSTQRAGQPYSSLMAFAYTSDLKNIVVATGKSTRKHQNIVQESRVSLLIDNRSNSEDDFQAAMALTVLGKAQLIQEAERQGYRELYLSRHPYLENFLASPSTAFLRILVYHYLLVSRFQNVMEYNIRDEVDLFTG